MTDVNKKSSSQEKVIHDYFDSLLQDDLSINNKKLNPSIPLVEKSEKYNATQPQQKKTRQPVLTKSTATEVLKSFDKSDEKVSPENTITKPVMGLDQLISEIPENQVKTQLETATKIESKIDLKSVGIGNDDCIADEHSITRPPMGVNTEDCKVSESGVPDWAETRFQCLLFNVSGLNLAVPLMKLNSVIPWDKNITITPNKTKWYLGLVQHLQNQVKIIDTALLVLPENRRQNLSDDSNGRLSHILLVDDFKWGLACSSIGEVIWLNKEEVKWRKNKSSKVWLSGTSLEHLCAIMDTEVFAKMLNESTQ